MKNNIISSAIWDFSVETTALIGIFLGVGLWILYEVVWHRQKSKGRRRKEMVVDPSLGENSDQSDDWDLYKGLRPEHRGYQDWIAELTAGRISTAEFKRRTENQKEYLLELIDNLLAGQISFKDFAESYCPFVLNLVPDFMSQRDEEFFEMVREKLERVSRSSAARREDDMVITPAEFIEWLGEEKAKHFEEGEEHGTPNPRA